MSCECSLYMCPSMLPQCDSTEREVSVSARCIDTDRQSCIPMHIPSSRAHHLQTNKTPPKKKTWTATPFPRPHTHTHSHTYTYKVTCTVAPAASHSSASHTGRVMAAKDFAFIDRKTRGQLFGGSIVWYSLPLFPTKWAAALSLSPSHPSLSLPLGTRDGAFPETR